MIEVDFLPEWYCLRRRRQQTMQRQWVALGLIFLVMIAWNSLTARSISLASAELSLGETQRIQAEHMSQNYKQLRKRLIHLQKKLNAKSLLEVRLDVAARMMQLSHMIPEDAVLQKLQFKAEKFSDLDGGASDSVMNSDRQESNHVFLVIDPGEVRFRVTLRATINDTEAVVRFLSDLEQSPHFQKVRLCYLRSKGDSAEATKRENNADDSVSSGGHRSRTNEFEIQCYLDQYDQSD
jgi:hypothetical protein